MPILPTQQKFDKAIPIVFGNAEYNTERELLITIDEVIRQCGLEKIVTAYFLDAARVNKMIAIFGTDKPVRLTEKELMHAKDDAVLALRASILRKRLKLSLRKFALALSHSDLYKWFCRINRFFDPKVPGKSHLGDMENMLPVPVIKQLETRLLRSAADQTSEVLYEPVDLSQCYLDSTCIMARSHPKTLLRRITMQPS